MIENIHPRPVLITVGLGGCFSPSPLTTRHCLRGGEEKALAAMAANRDNPTFKNRRNPMNPNDITFSNRDKNTTSGSPHLRPHIQTGIRNRSKLLKRWTDDGF
jgi:hypothetical protein